jgi:hypothetical protein
VNRQAEWARLKGLCDQLGVQFNAVYKQKYDPAVNDLPGVCWALTADWARAQLQKNTLPDLDPEHPVWNFFNQIHRGQTAPYASRQKEIHQADEQRLFHQPGQGPLGPTIEEITGVVSEKEPLAYLQALTHPRQMEEEVTEKLRSVVKAEAPFGTEPVQGIFYLFINGGAHVMGLAYRRLGAEAYWTVFDANCGEFSQLKDSFFSAVLCQYLNVQYGIGSRPFQPLWVHRVRLAD